MSDDLLDVLPTILASLEDPSTSRDTLLQLAQLVDNISGAAALELGEALRALGAIDTLAALLDAEAADTLRLRPPRVRRRALGSCSAARSATVPAPRPWPQPQQQRVQRDHAKHT